MLRAWNRWVESREVRRRLLTKLKVGAARIAQPRKAAAFDHMARVWQARSPRSLSP